MTDAPDPAANAVRDNIARAAMPQPTQLAQNVFPPVASDASKAVMPGGFQPPGPPQPPPAPPAPAIRAAPPAATIQAAPPEVRPLSKPTPPQLQPMVNDRVRYYDAQTRNPYLSDTARAAAQEQIKQEQLQIKAANDQLTSQYNDYQKRYLDQQDPKNVYSTEKERRGLIPEGFFALTPEERARVPVVPGVDFYKDRWGNLKEVKSPISVQQTVDTAGEKQESKTGGELAAKRQGEMIEAANKAGENLTTDCASGGAAQAHRYQCICARQHHAVRDGACGRCLRRLHARAGTKAGADRIQAGVCSHRQRTDDGQDRTRRHAGQ